MERNLKVLALMAGLIVLPMSAFAKAGDIVLTQGAAFVRNPAGVERPATLGMPVDSGETLVTRDGRLQVKFTDSGVVSLQPETQFAIADYRYAEANKGESAFFKLIKGGFRTITGLVGKRDKSVYRVDTAVATIGVRGTEYQAMLCASSCKQPDGLYVHTGEGTIFVKNVAGEIDVGKGQTAFVASADTAPQRTTVAPPMTARVTTSAPPAISGVGTTEFVAGNIVGGGNSQGAVTNVASGGVAFAASGTASGTVSSNFFNSFSGSISGAGSGSGATDAMPSGVLSGVYMNGSAITGGVVTANGGVASAIFSSPPVNVGSNGDLYWGRWTNTTLDLYAGLGSFFAKGSLTIPATSSIHYLLGTTSPTIPTTNTSATYQFVGGTPSTDASGRVGSGITGGSITAYFGANQLSVNYVPVSHYGNYTMSGTVFFGQNRATFGGLVSAMGAASVPVKVEGFFVGSSSPTGAGLSYTINPNGSNPIVGVGAFRN